MSCDFLGLRPRLIRAHGRHYKQSGMLPGLTYYICAWYPKFAQAKRIGFMYSGVALAGAFGGLLAYVIQDEMHGYVSSS